MDSKRITFRPLLLGIHVANMAPNGRGAFLRQKELRSAALLAPQKVWLLREERMKVVSSAGPKC